MKREIKEGFNKFYQNIDSEKYYLVLTDDNDSLLSCLFLQKQFPKLKIGGFYDYKSLYLDEEITKDKQPVYVDADMKNELCFGNHVTPFTGENCINMNNNLKEYYKKYAGSTLMMLYSLYDYNIADRKESFIIESICCDSFYKPFYHADKRFNEVFSTWIEKLELEYLLPTLKKYDDNFFAEFKTRNKLNSKIYFSNGKLKSDLHFLQFVNDLNLKKVTDVKTKFVDSGKETELDKSTMFSSAMTYKNKMVINYIV